MKKKILLILLCLLSATIFCFTACMVDGSQSESVDESFTQSEEIKESIPENESGSEESVEGSETVGTESDDSTKESQSEKETVSDWVDIEFPQP